MSEATQERARNHGLIKSHAIGVRIVVRMGIFFHPTIAVKQTDRPNLTSVLGDWSQIGATVAALMMAALPTAVNHSRAEEIAHGPEESPMSVREPLMQRGEE